MVDDREAWAKSLKELAALPKGFHQWETPEGDVWDITIGEYAVHPAFARGDGASIDVFSL